jgi:nucleoside phosphorylase/tetratricopeptide (TPR) repeat protein
MGSASADRERAEALARRVTVGIVTALEEECAAMLAMLDRPVRWSATGDGSGLAYHLGEIRAYDGRVHVVALALADMGNNIAAVRGTLLLQHFREVEAIVMVGIAGGVPRPDKASDHVRLGDVVVSNQRGVIQYDMVKRSRKIVEVRASPRPPDARLLEAVRLLGADALAGERPWEKHVDRASHLAGAARPEASSDVLMTSQAPFAPVKHSHDARRIAGQPRVFTAPIASGNTLLKDPVWRDRLRDDHGVKAVEMEGSGIADATWSHRAGYLVVRGICDYCDKNKNDDWHMYAAIVAAAYARALLERMTGGGLPLDEDESESPKSAPRTPHNLTARNRDFRGRGEELAALDEALQNETRTTITHASVFGLGGIGKTSLALEYAHRAVERGEYPGGVWWLHAEGKPVDALVNLAPVLRRHATAEVQQRLAGEETRAEAIADAVRLALQAQRARSLLVLDNVSDAGWASHLPAGVVRVLVTTRDEALAQGSSRRLGVLLPAQAREVADGIAGAPRGVAEASAQERVLVTELGGLAVAVAMAARAVKAWLSGSWIRYERVLGEEMNRVLMDPKLVGEYGRGVFAAIDLSIDRCDPDALALLEGAAVFAPEAVPLAWALEAAGLESEGAKARATATVKELGVVSPDEDARTVSLHRLVHRQVRSRAARTERADAWREVSRRGARAAALWIAGAVEMNQTRAEMEAVDARREHLDAALDAADRVDSQRAWIATADGLARHLQNRARSDEARTLFLQALARAEALVPPDLACVAIRLANLATLLLQLGDADRAKPLLERALGITEATEGPEHPNVATCLSNLAGALKYLGDAAGAKPLLERALGIHEATFGPEHPKVATRLSNLATVLRDLGDTAGAKPLLDRALAIDEATFGPEHPRVAIGLSNLATMLRDLGDTAGAKPLMDRALAIDVATFGPEHPNVAMGLWNLATVLKDLGDAAGAKLLLERAVAIIEARLPPSHPYQGVFREGLAILTRNLPPPTPDPSPARPAKLPAAR